MNQRAVNQRTVEKRVLLTPAEERQVLGLLDSLSKAADCRITFSDLVRSCLSLAQQGKQPFGAQLRDSGPFSRPVTVSVRAMKSFEDQLASHLLSALRKKR